MVSKRILFLLVDPDFWKIKQFINGLNELEYPSNLAHVLNAHQWQNVTILNKCFLLQYLLFIEIEIVVSWKSTPPQHNLKLLPSIVIGEMSSQQNMKRNSLSISS